MQAQLIPGTTPHVLYCQAARTMNSPDIPLDIQLFLHSLCMWLQAAQAVTGIVHSPRCLVPVQWVGWETQLTTDGQSHSLSI